MKIIWMLDTRDHRQLKPQIRTVWVVSVTPSGGWVPACIAGPHRRRHEPAHAKFLLDASVNPFNVVETRVKRPRVTLTPTLAMNETAKPFLAFAVQGGDTQDQNLLQFFLMWLNLE
jgi:gamma-glutamyltranspeptidase/glutathione hydrolase